VLRAVSSAAGLAECQPFPVKKLILISHLQTPKSVYLIQELNFKVAAAVQLYP